MSLYRTIVSVPIPIYVSMLPSRQANKFENFKSQGLSQSGGTSRWDSLTQEAVTLGYFRMALARWHAQGASLSLRTPSPQGVYNW